VQDVVVAGASVEPLVEDELAEDDEQPASVPTTARAANEAMAAGRARRAWRAGAGAGTG